MDAYESWDLFLLFCSIIVLVFGVVLLTNKKPDQPAHQPSNATALARIKHRRLRKAAKTGDEEEAEGLHPEGEDVPEGAETLWELGDASDDEDDPNAPGYRSPRPEGTGLGVAGGEGERARMIEDQGEDDDEENRASVSSDATLAHPSYTDDFEDWGAGKGKPAEPSSPS